MTKRLSAKELMDDLLERLPDKETMTEDQMLERSKVALVAAQYDAMCGIEAELREIAFAFTQLNRTILATVTKNMTVTEVPTTDAAPKN